MKKLSFLVIATVMIAFLGNAQNIKEMNFEYVNIKQPLLRLPADVKNYQVEMLAPYEEKNRKAIAEYEAKKKKAQEDYEAATKQYYIDLKAAEERYEKEMEAYKKKSLGTKAVEKVLLNENTKPVKQLPSKPYLYTVEKPVLLTTYDLPVLGSTYIKMEQLENNPSNALKIIVTLYGYDFTQPRVVSTQRNMVNIGSSNSYTATFYYTEYSYRHPMAVKMLLPDGKEVLNVTPQPLNAYKIAQGPQLERMPTINNELLVKTSEEKTLQENLQYINKLINEKFGFYREKRKAIIYFVKNKNELYTDLTTAANEAQSAFQRLADDSANAKPQLVHAVEIWNNALRESNPQDKKARIDKDVTLAVCFNLLEANLALKNHAEGFAILQKMNAFSLSMSERGQKNAFENDYADLKKRINNQ